ncbi:MAG: bifunctional folylpolyglutamate synthase/dihydrofolate synthase, partial [Deltaproteobacteria bacterium]|nr:bifunctional folylpolyglutamate synthase/dihydrofolate synthase [Deltaproteobacteria bacterium]
MKEPRDISRCARVLRRLYALQRLGVKPGLGRIKKLLAALGDPHKAYPSIHVAGTNGKGSTSAILHSILSQRYRTGLYTSPHLRRFNERIRVNGALIKDSEVVRAVVRIEVAAKKAGIRGLTFFEFTTAMALLHFRDKGVEAAVLETGMGGRWDATNAVEPVVSVITNIGLDHTEFLGPDIKSVAFEKAGIIKKSTPVVTGTDKREALRVLCAAAREKNSPILTLGADFKTDPAAKKGRFDYSGPLWTLKGLSVGLRGAHQRRNAACALAALETVSGRFKVTEKEIRRGVAGVVWPGRVEVLKTRPLVIVDSAHNPEGAATLRDALGSFKYSRLILVIGVMADKDIDGLFA